MMPTEFDVRGDSPRPASNRPWRKTRIAGRVLLFFAATITFALGWIVHRHNQRLAVFKELSHYGIGVKFDYEMDDSGNFMRNRHPSVPNWLRKLVGDDYFGDVVCADCSSTGIRDSDLAELSDSLHHFGQLQWLDLRDTKISDAGLLLLADFSNLKRVCLYRVPVTPGGVANLARAMPNLQIVR